MTILRGNPVRTDPVRTDPVATSTRARTSVQYRHFCVPDSALERARRWSGVGWGGWDGAVCVG